MAYDSRRAVHHSSINGEASQRDTPAAGLGSKIEDAVPPAHEENFVVLNSDIVAQVDKGGTIRTVLKPALICAGQHINYGAQPNAPATDSSASYLRTSVTRFPTTVGERNAVPHRHPE